MTNDEIIAKFYEAVQSGDYQSFLDTVLHTQYIGARYVPIFADPLQWSNANTYEPLTIVTNQGNSYTSRQYVPTGIDIANTDYWALTGNYNAQIEQYREEVQQYVTQVSAFQDQIDQANTNAQDALDTINNKRILVIGDSFSDSAGYDSVTPWPTILQQWGYTVHNYADGGAGFLSTGSSGSSVTFINQLNNAISELSNNDFDICIVYGGLNDFTQGHTHTVTRQAAINFITTYFNTYDKPLFIALGNVANPFKDELTLMPQWITNILNALNQTRAIIVNSSNWLINYLGNLTTDTTHPTQFLQNVLANKFQSIIQKNNTNVIKSFQYGNINSPIMITVTIDDNNNPIFNFNFNGVNIATTGDIQIVSNVFKFGWQGRSIYNVPLYDINGSISTIVPYIICNGKDGTISYHAIATGNLIAHS